MSLHLGGREVLVQSITICSKQSCLVLPSIKIVSAENILLPLVRTYHPYLGLGFQGIKEDAPENLQNWRDPYSRWSARESRCFLAIPTTSSTYHSHLFDFPVRRFPIGNTLPVPDEGSRWSFQLHSVTEYELMEPCRHFPSYREGLRR